MKNRKGQYAILCGKKIGKLEVLKQAKEGKRIYWECRCDCGRIVLVRTDSLNGDGRHECGKCRPLPKTKTVEYQAWRGMINRCEVAGKQTKDYAGRGISVCEKWRHDFAAFLADVGPKPSPDHTLDRFPNGDGNYEPGNVRWATWREQLMNRRNSVLVTYCGETHGLREWAELLGKKSVTLYWRYLQGWRDEKLFS